MVQHSKGIGQKIVIELLPAQDLDHVASGESSKTKSKKPASHAFTSGKELKKHCRDLLFSDKYEPGEYLDEEDYLFMKAVFSYHPQFYNVEVDGDGAVGRTGSEAAKQNKAESAAAAGGNQNQQVAKQENDLKNKPRTRSGSQQEMTHKVSRVHVNLSTNSNHLDHGKPHEADINAYTRIGITWHSLHANQRCFFLQKVTEKPKTEKPSKNVEADEMEVD
ncbi:unnamed protein product, partial [Amoebophrya sp. A120]|eukprot:GSA120T00019839001.1